MPDQNNNIQQSLLDFHATILAKPNLSDKDLLQKFPEFGNDSKKLQAAKDYAATMESGKYKSTSEFNNKFPEFFGQQDSKKPQQEPKPIGLKPLKEKGLLSTYEEMKAMPTTPMHQAIAEDRETNYAFGKSLWNAVINSAERLGGSMAELATKGTFSAGVGAPGLGGDFKQPEFTKEQRIQMAKDIKSDMGKEFYGKAKFDVSQKSQNEMKFDLKDGLGISDFEGLGIGTVGLLSDLGLNALTGGKGITFALQAMNDAFDEYDKTAESLSLIHI